MSDEERHEVALRLRDEAAHGEMHIRDFLEALCACIKTGRNEYRALLRLADLIDPGDMSQGRRDIVACDRDALLALADEMDAVKGFEPPYKPHTYPSRFVRVEILHGYARRIREALGVVA